ncbi:MAG: ABC transporter ATP-binding protein [Candidatus Promineifilaceae bacterium]
MTPAIETTGLSKKYGDVTAVADLSLHVAQGEIYAFLGLNGAGKTTTIRMLLGLVGPTAGSAAVLGERVAGGRGPWHAVGYLVERPHAYPELTVRENLDAARRLRPGTSPLAVEWAIEQLGLTAYADRRSGTLSQGNAQRLGLAKALLHDPRLLILDEPANGLDPAGIVEIRHLLRRLADDQGVAIFISSHILGEVTRLADRVGIIHEGRLLQELSRAELEGQRRRWLHIQVRQPLAAQRALAAAGYSAAMDNGALPRAGLHLVDERALARPEQIATLLVQSGNPPAMLAVEQEELEQYFLRLVGPDQVAQGREVEA